ncbi:MAG TPA: metal-dependent hydrolase, partial [Candidatus Limnocylindrales bacterium]|nr:metal-dependent hydrolase [Candidatus Limnocylindrales bacterium]
EKALVTVAAIAPDIDSVGILPELLTRNTAHPLLWFSEYHHSLHTLAFSLLCSCGSFVLLRKTSTRWHTSSVVFVSFHLHLLGDLVGARGPDGYQWPIPYLKPFSDALQLSWYGEWALNAWQNIMITCSLLAVTLWIAWKRGESPVQFVSEKADRALTQVLRARFSR